MRRIVDIQTHSEPYVTVRELAEYFQFERRMVIKWIRSGQLQAELVDGAWRIATADALALEARRRIDRKANACAEERSRRK